jgi:phage baseplate assembly protein V
MSESIFRRIQMMFGRGRVTYVDDSGPVQKVQVRLSGLETSDNRLRMMEFGFTSNPPDGTDVLALHISGDRSAGTVFATNHQESRPTGLQSGESMVYQPNGIQVYLSNQGLVINAGGLPVVCNNATNFTVNCSGIFKVVAPGGVQFVSPLLTNSGDIQDNAATNTKTMAAMRANYNAHGHPVVNVQTGGSTITSGTPTVTE